MQNIPHYDTNQALTNPTRTLGPAVKWRAITPGQSLGTTARWLSVGANGGSGGTITYIATDGSTITNFPVDPGYHFFLFTQIVSVVGATNLWWSD